MAEENRTDIEIFDRAIYEYLSTISERVVYATTHKAVQTITKDAKYKDAIPYHFISFYRDPTFDIDNERYNFTAANFGDVIRLREYDNGDLEARYVKNLPVNLTYQIDIWASKEKNVQAAAISLISKIHMENQIVLAGMEPDGGDARFHITQVNWVDNSDLEVENEKGKLYRHTITITIDARIKLVLDVPTTEFKCIPVDIYENDE